MVTNPSPNNNIHNRQLTDELINTITNKIKLDFDNLDPKVEYEIQVLSTNGKNKYIEVDIYDREFMVSPYFTQYLIDIQEKFLWPLGVYNTLFIYNEKSEK